MNDAQPKCVVRSRVQLVEWKNAELDLAAFLLGRVKSWMEMQ